MLIGVLGGSITPGGALDAQSLTSGALSGVALDSAGGPIAGAIVTVMHVATGVDRATTTGRDGRFRFAALVPGSYEVLVEDVGLRPARLVGVAIGATDVVEVVVRLTPQAPPVLTADSIRYPSAGALTSRGAAARRLGALELARAPDDGRLLDDVGRYFANATNQLEVDGLSKAMSTRLIDGVPYVGPRHPALLHDPTSGIAFPLLALDQSELVTNDGDVERSEYAAGQLAGYSRPGTQRLRFRLFGDWSGDALRSSDRFDPGAAAHTSLRGGLLVSGPVIPDTAHFALGIDAQRVEEPLLRTWENRDGDSLLLAAGDSNGVDLRGALAPRIANIDRVTGFGRFDWRLAERHLVTIRASGGRLTGKGLELDAERWPNTGRVVGTDVTAGGTLSSEFGGGALNELRVGLEIGTRVYSPGGLPGTTILEGDIRLGSGPMTSGRFERTTLRLSEALQIPSGNHLVKIGVTGSISSFEQAFAAGNAGTFVFADLTRFEAMEGVFMRVGATPPVARFSNNLFAAFLQDTWAVTPQFDLLAGLRYENEFLPTSRVPANDAWRDRTGLFNDSLSTHRGKFSPRVGFTWRLGDRRWVVRAQGGVFYDRIDPGLLAELISHAPGIDVRYGVGALGTWPGQPGDAAAPVQGARLMLLGPEFESPRSSRGSFSISRHFGAASAVHVSTAYRHTDFLPRRANLNRLLAPAGADQDGRPLWGTLVQQGALLTAGPGTNRRFSDFDLVTAVNVDGYSDYWDVSMGLEHRVGRFLELAARYTYSQTTDNWLGGGAGGPAAQLDPFPEGLGGADWSDGRSDFDIPHRFVLIAELRPLGRPGFAVTGVYRFRSGRAFTPGFQDGVDANGDGVAGNDPAFVDADIEGVSDLFGTWDCLAASAGRFVERNACREQGEARFDLRAVIGPLYVATYPVELVVDAVNVLDGPRAVRDHALYRVDAAGVVTNDPATGVVTVPLVVNPRFGAPLAFRGTGRVLRAGLRVNY